MRSCCWCLKPIRRNANSRRIDIDDVEGRRWRLDWHGECAQDDWVYRVALDEPRLTRQSVMGLKGRGLRPRPKVGTAWEIYG